MPKIQIRWIFYVNFEGFKMSFWKKVRRQKLFMLIISIDFLYFFWFMIIQKAQNLSWKMRKMFFSKNSFTKCVIIVANLQQMLQKNFSTIFWYLNSFKIFFWLYVLQSSKENPTFSLEREISFLLNLLSFRENTGSLL